MSFSSLEQDCYNFSVCHLSALLSFYVLAHSAIAYDFPGESFPKDKSDVITLLSYLQKKI